MRSPGRCRRVGVARRFGAGSGANALRRDTRRGPQEESPMTSSSITYAAPSVAGPRPHLQSRTAHGGAGRSSETAAGAGAQTLGEMILRSGNRPGAALRYKEAGSWREISYAQLVSCGPRHREGPDRTRDRARGAGFDPGDTRPEWTSPMRAASVPGPSWHRSTTPTRPRSASTCCATPRPEPCSARTRRRRRRSIRCATAAPRSST